MRQSLRELPLAAVVWYLAGTLLLLVAINLAVLSANTHDGKDSQGKSVLNLLGRLDGEFYRRILEYGYDYSRTQSSSAPFFPGYPGMAKALHDCGIPARWALLAVSWSALLGALVMAQRYLRYRLPRDDQRATASLALAALALNPMTFYMRFMYSESLFLLLLILLLDLLQRRAQPLAVAVVCGALTGVRVPGVVIIPVVLLYAWNYSPAPRARAIHLALSLAVCGWGIALFVWHLHADFGDALAFVYAQEAYERHGHSLFDKLSSMATLGPLRRMFDPASIGYWNARHTGSLWVFSTQVGDAFFWALFAVLIAWGGWKRWLSREELLISALLFAFGTWFQADRSDMACQGRYTSVIFPAYIVTGRLLAAIRWEIRLALAIAAAGMYIHYAVVFALGHSY